MTMVEDGQQAKQGLQQKIVAEYGSLLERHGKQGPVLEIARGARADAIAFAPFLSGQECHVIGRRRGDESRTGVRFHDGDDSAMADLFADACFATVLWDRGIERDPSFWLTLAEIRRVLMPGGTLIVCTRGFGRPNRFGVKVAGANGNPLPSLTATAAASPTAPDFWRISPKGMRKGILKGFEVREVRMCLMVPHLFGVGVKSA